MSETQKKKSYVAKKGKPAHNKGIPASVAQKKKQSEAMKGRKTSEATKKKQSDAYKYVKQTDAAKKKMSAGRKGKPWTEAQKKKLSATLQGIPYDEWESFASKSLYCPKFDETCRESNRDKYDRECFICSKSEKDNGQRLSVHHVDMSKNQGCDGIGWKLIPLCRSCHAKAHGAEIISRLEYVLSSLYNKVVSCTI